uniref:Poor homologous synapsis 1 PH domain-containing protein n=1 Tax=Nelumbo nucifera TaxID=4432 RepID=A0A822YTN3_NELNU|nr:TPA_asm: hypothetical protein HUJ06_005125 [Nelumbo nucifera]
MAGALSLATAAENLVTSLNAIKDHWEVEYSRFFNLPPPSSSTSLTLKPLGTSKRSRCKGTWISSSSTAALHLLTYHPSPEVIVVVTLRGKIHVSCVYQCPTRGSRVVFASYRDCEGQIQKFALRFSTSCEAERFINALKERLKDIVNIRYPLGNFGSEISSQSELISSSVLQNRTDEELSCLTPVDTYTPQTAQPNYKGEQQTCSQEPEPEVDHNFDGTFESLPPSFTALLTSCSSEAEQDTAEKQQVAEEVDLKSQITKYMSDTCFSEMLNKVEKVIFQMGGELAL